MQCTVATCFSFLLAEVAEKLYSLLPHVAEDEIASSDDDSSDSEESDVEVNVAREPVAPPWMVRFLCMNWMFASRLVSSNHHLDVISCPYLHSLLLTRVGIRHC